MSATPNPALDTMRARVAAAKVEADKDILGDDDREEARLRAELATHEATRKTKEREARALDLSRREDAARESLGPTIPIATMEGESDGAAQTFVVMQNGKAFDRWEKGIQMSVEGRKDPTTGKKVDRAENTRRFALASVYDWNGVVVPSDKDAQAKLLRLFESFQGLASMISNAAAKLNGYALEEAKSPG